MDLIGALLAHFFMSFSKNVDLKEWKNLISIKYLYVLNVEVIQIKMKIHCYAKNAMYCM